MWVPAALQPDAFDVFVPQNGAELAAWTPPATPRHACIVTYDLVQVMKRAQTDRWAVRHCIHEQCMHTRYVYMQDMRGMRLTRPAALRGRPARPCGTLRPTKTHRGRPAGLQVGFSSSTDAARQAWRGTHACVHAPEAEAEAGARACRTAGLQGCMGMAAGSTSSSAMRATSSRAPRRSARR